jgi:hypothetical protein
MGLPTTHSLWRIMTMETRPSYRPMCSGSLMKFPTFVMNKVIATSLIVALCLREHRFPPKIRLLPQSLFSTMAIVSPVKTTPSPARPCGSLTNIVRESFRSPTWMLRQQKKPMRPMALSSMLLAVRTDTKLFSANNSRGRDQTLVAAFLTSATAILSREEAVTILAIHGSRCPCLFILC